MLFEYIQKIKDLDFMTPPVQLNIGGKSGVKTYFGVSMTVLYLVCVCIFSYVIILTFLDSTSPAVTQETSQSSINPKIDMIQNNLFPVIYLLAYNIYPVPAAYAPHYVTIAYNKFSIIGRVNPDGSSNITYHSSIMPVIPCSQALLNSTLYEVYKNYLSTDFFKQHGNTSGLCPQFYPNESFVSGGGSDSSMDFLQLEVYPCTLLNSSMCANLTELMNLNIIVTQPSSSISLGNYTNPVKSYLNADVNYFINTQMSQKYSQPLMNTEIWDQSQVFSTNSLRSNFSSIEKTVFISQTRDPTQLTCPGVTQFDASNCFPYLTFQYMSGPNKLIYVRSYKTLTQALSQVGGINNVVMLVFIYINLIYNYYATKTLLVEKVFKFFSIVKVQPRGESEGGGGGGAEKTENQHGAIQPNSKDPQSPTIAQNGDPHLINPLSRLSQKELENLKDEAYEVICKNLDIITLVREINNLKVLTQLLFKDYQQKLIPLISLNMQAQKDREKKELERSRKEKKSKTKVTPVNPNDESGMTELIGNKTPSSRRARKSIFPSASGLALGASTRQENPEFEGGLNFNMAFNLLEENRKLIASIPRTDWTLEQRIEMFCYEGLDHTGGSGSTPAQASGGKSFLIGGTGSPLKVEAAKSIELAEGEGDIQPPPEKKIVIHDDDDDWGQKESARKEPQQPVPILKHEEQGGSIGLKPAKILYKKTTAN